MAEPQAQSLVGRVIAGRYRIERRLSGGGMGSVWRAEHLALRSVVAVKFIDPLRVSQEEFQTRFLREAQAAAALRSPHVVQILDYGVENEIPYIVMELLEGETLEDRLHRYERLSPSDTAWIMSHVARAMARAHAAGIVHRDLKPANIFLVHNEEEEVAKVLDFGVAKTAPKVLDRTTGTHSGALLGTPYYMSPEQAEGDRGVDHRTDLWAMAVIAFECLTGRRPFDSEALGGLLLQICARAIPVPSQYVPVPPGFDAWFAHGTQRDPDSRFQSASELAHALRVVLTHSAARDRADPTPPVAMKVERADPGPPALALTTFEPSEAPPATTTEREFRLPAGIHAEARAEPAEESAAAGPSTVISVIPGRRRTGVFAAAAVALAVIIALAMLARQGGSDDAGAAKEAQNILRPAEPEQPAAQQPTAAAPVPVAPVPASKPPASAVPLDAVPTGSAAPARVESSPASRSSTTRFRARTTRSRPSRGTRVMDVTNPYQTGVTNATKPSGDARIEPTPPPAATARAASETTAPAPRPEPERTRSTEQRRDPTLGF